MKMSSLLAATDRGMAVARLTKRAILFIGLAVGDLLSTAVIVPMSMVFRDSREIVVTGSEPSVTTTSAPAEPGSRTTIALVASDAVIAAINKAGCTECHTIRGIPGATGTVGPTVRTAPDTQSGVTKRSKRLAVIGASPAPSALRRNREATRPNSDCHSLRLAQPVPGLAFRRQVANDPVQGGFKKKGRIPFSDQ